MSKPNSPFLREIKSFVKREGRLTPGQQRALETQWSHFGRDIAQGELATVPKRILEIGFGNGKSLLAMAAAEPEVQYVGIEVHRPGVGALLMGVAEHQLENVLVYQEDAVEVLKQCIADDSLDRLQLYFPDPWPKKKHHKRRIVQPAFVELVRQKLKVGGVLHMTTDWQAYAEHMLAVMQQAEGFQNLSTTNDFCDKPDYRPTTKFEQRGQKLGHGVWDLLFERG